MAYLLQPNLPRLENPAVPDVCANEEVFVYPQPSSMNYGNVLLRFPREELPLKRDVDWYTHSTIDPTSLEIKVNENWAPLHKHLR